jgi:O-antigen biosynthesis protein WbqP
VLIYLLLGLVSGLLNKTELTQARDAKGVFAVRLGITGLAQISDIDMSTPELLAETDAKMI